MFGKSKHKYKKSLSDWIINSLKNKKKIYVFKDIYFNPISLLTLSKIRIKVSDMAGYPCIALLNDSSEAVGFSKMKTAKSISLKVINS